MLYPQQWFQATGNASNHNTAANTRVPRTQRQLIITNPNTDITDLVDVRNAVNKALRDACTGQHMEFRRAADLGGQAQHQVIQNPLGRLALVGLAAVTLLALQHQRAAGGQVQVIGEL